MWEIFLDIVVFDVVWHERFICKMDCIGGVSGMPLKFLQNVAPNRHQQVELNANIQYGHQYLLVYIRALYWTNEFGNWSNQETI